MPRTAWVDERDQQLLADHDIKVMHCPGSNLKLGSGIAPVPEMRARGITVSLGADGAACNNRLDMFEEMRLAAVLQAMRRDPGILPARDVLWMATRAGARTLGLDADIGSIEVGKKADVIVVDRDRPHLAPGPDPYSTLVYAARGRRADDGRDGEVLVDDFNPVRFTGEVAAESRRAAKDLAGRARSGNPVIVDPHACPAAASRRNPHPHRRRRAGRGGICRASARDGRLPAHDGTSGEQPALCTSKGIPICSSPT